MQYPFVLKLKMEPNGHCYSSDNELHGTMTELQDILSGGFQQAFNKCVEH
jgi:hypothetical protein